MDLRRPSQLQTTITQMFAREVERALGDRVIHIAPSAFLPLVEPGRNARYNLANVNEGRLRLALRAVAANLDEVLGADRVLEEPHVQAAIRRSSCHYLWFC